MVLSQSSKTPSQTSHFVPVAGDMTAGAIPAVAFVPQASYLGLQPRYGKYLLKFGALFLTKMIVSTFGSCACEANSEFSGYQFINPGITLASYILLYLLNGKGTIPGYTQPMPNIYGPAANQPLIGAKLEFQPPHQFYGQKLPYP
ncbi:MAG: hypothetical protein EZS28_048589 [Streblomastix strix]|uniref:Uncharacterized protein n=1 Tax=Streblomastix strix TaxID=222440 RepID=A0A5J4TEH8_9EUKA|nr:MAG: hypothetical protein EZS28_048589 [Streblomastix strix]